MKQTLQITMCVHVYSHLRLHSHSHSQRVRVNRFSRQTHTHILPHATIGEFTLTCIHFLQICLIFTPNLFITDVQIYFTNLLKLKNRNDGGNQDVCAPVWRRDVFWSALDEMVDQVDESSSWKTTIANQTTAYTFLKMNLTPSASVSSISLTTWKLLDLGGTSQYSRRGSATFTSYVVSKRIHGVWFNNEFMKGLLKMSQIYIHSALSAL